MVGGRWRCILKDKTTMVVLTLHLLLQTHNLEGNTDMHRIGVLKERRLSKEEKKRLTCNHCKESGHEAHEYFKLHGYPERYKRYRDTKGKTKVNYMMDVPDDDTSSKSGERYESRTQYEQQFQQLDIASLIQAEVAKCMNNLGNSSGTTPAPRTDINFVQEGEGQGIFFMDTMHSA